MIEENYYDFDLTKDWGKQLKEAYMFAQRIKKDIVKELINCRETDLVREPSNIGEWYMALFPCGKMFYAVDCRVDPSDKDKIIYVDCMPKPYTKDGDTYKQQMALDMDDLVACDAPYDPELEELCEYMDSLEENGPDTSKDPD